MTSARVPLLLLVLILLGSLGLPRALPAQQVEREVQVPLDEARGILEVDSRLRSELGLFPEVEGFVVARLYRTDAGMYVLEITSTGLGRLARERRRLGESELAAFRADVQTRLNSLGRERVVDRSGRSGFVVGQTAIALGYHGWAIPTALDIDSDRGRVASYLLIGATGFLVPWIITQNKAVSDAQRDAAFWGGTRGILYGLILGDMLAPEDDPDPFVSSDTDLRVRLGVGSLASVFGTIAGYNTARLADHDPGRVALWAAAGDFGLAMAFGTSYALGLYDSQNECINTGEQFCDTGFKTTTGGHVTTLGLGLASLYGAKRWGEAEDYTVGDARALRSFGLLGAHALLGPAVYAFEDRPSDDDRLIVASALVGTAAGLFLGNRALRSTSLSDGDGALVLAGHVAGGLAALGVTYLLDGGGDADAEVYLSTSALGAGIGSLLTFRAVRGARGLPNAPPPPDDGGTRMGGNGAPKLTIHPTGVFSSVLALAGVDSSRPRSSTLLSLQF